MATSARSATRSNEDFVGAVPNAVVLLDGAGIPGMETLCRHGVAWYTHRLGGTLLGLLSRDDGRDLAALLGEAIDEVTGDHRDTCDVGNPSSPSATVLLFRLSGSQAEYLILADCFLLLDQRDRAPLLLTDQREVAVRDRFHAAMAGYAEGTPEYDRVRNEQIQVLRASRNHPNGFWVAKDDPRAAAEAVRGSVPTADLHRVVLLSNGFRSAEWSQILPILNTEADTSGPAEVIARLREPNDDATIACCTQLSG